MDAATAEPVSPLTPEGSGELHTGPQVSTQPANVARNAARNTTKPRIKPTLRYRKTPACLLFIYLPTLIVPWVLICIMTKRPLGGSSYYDQTGAHYVNNLAGAAAATLLKTINAVLAVPIISTLLGHAAIVHAMRRHRTQKLNVMQLFALADKGWSNVPLLWGSFSHKKASRFLWLAALLTALGAVLQPLISILVTFDEVAAVSCADVFDHSCSLFGPEIIAYDPEPADMAILQRDIILQDVISNLVTMQDSEPQANLWPVNPNANEWIGAYTQPPNRQIFLVYTEDFGFDPEGFFATALANGTVTGVLREHAIRLNSSVHCEHIQFSDFPSPCPGAQPLETAIERTDVSLRVCVPGNSTLFPFTASRNRQDITEDLFISLEVSDEMQYLSNSQNFTMHCTSSTSRGYFELGSEQNHYIYGPLLDKWPDPEDIVKNSNDFRGVMSYYARPTEEDPLPASFLNDDLLIAPFNSYNHPSTVAGPLMVSAEALFGNYSLLRFIADNTTQMTPAQAYATVCETGRIPFSQSNNLYQIGGGPDTFCADAAGHIQTTFNTSDDSYHYDLDDFLSRITASHAFRFNLTQSAEYALMVSMFYANRAVLTKTAVAEYPFDARQIYYSPGTLMIRPRMDTASLVVITVFVALQTLGLLVVARLIYSVPTWGSALDAMEIARIGKALGDDDLPPIGPVSLKDEERLAKIDALVGTNMMNKVDDPEAANRETIAINTGSEESATNGEASSSGRLQLVLGGKGLITREIAREETRILEDGK
ncbi:hypothetical protein F5Y15DRAFT_287993 [Xylariaceae sp. FL0016]|nr:hypothetical protein F5Y15DRAFT_287993 [Xylariaceae sp. FL0016]